MKFHDPDDISSSRLNFMIKIKGQNWDEDGIFDHNAISSWRWKFIFETDYAMNIEILTQDGNSK